MKVIWRQQGKDWEIADGRHYKDEKHLQEFLAQNPSLIPFEDISKDILPPRVMIREVGLLGSGSSDIVGVDERGGITIIECKLATNPEIKRKVVGQVLEYAAFLWRKPYLAFNDIAVKRLGKPLLEVMRESIDEEIRHDWNDDDFVTAVTQTLDSGNFRLVIAVDNVNEELRRTIEYLAQTRSQLAIYALEIAYFSSKQGEILVPHLHGAAPTAHVGPEAVRWTAERFFEDARNTKHLPEPVLELLRMLLDFCEDEATRVYWGTGKQDGSFTFHYQNSKKTYSLFSAFSNGNLSINFGWLKDQAPAELVLDYLKALQEIKDFQKIHVRDDLRSWPTVKLTEALHIPEDLEKFKAVVLHMRDRLAEL